MSVPVRVSAREFIGRLRGAENGRIQEGTAGNKHEIMLIVTKPEKASGRFLAPRVPMPEEFQGSAWGYYILQYQAFVGEIYRLGEMTPEERRKAKLRINLPH